MAADEVELDTEQLLEQGDELLRSSRELLEQLDDAIDLTEVDGPPADQTGSSADSR